MEKLKRLFLVFLLTMVLLSVNISAALTDADIAYPLVPYFAGSYYGSGNRAFKDVFFCRVYRNNNVLMRIGNSEQLIPYYGFLYSNLQAGKLYKWQLQLDKPLELEDNTVGDLVQTNQTNLQIAIPAIFNNFPDLESQLDTGNAIVTNDNPLDLQGKTYSIPNTSYCMFYDQNNLTITNLLILPDDFFNGVEQLQIHAYILQSFGASMVEQNTSIVINQSISFSVNGDYSNVLNEIKQTLESQSGSGITPEQVENAVISALQQHDQQQESELNSAIQEGQDKIEEALDPYFNESQNFYITQTINTIKNDLLGYTGTQCVITFPKANNPMAQNAVLWPEKEIDIAAAYRTLPGQIRIIISALIDISVSLAIFLQVMSLIYSLIIKPGNGGVDDG